MSDDRKTKNELVEELESLRRRIEVLDSEIKDDAPKADAFDSDDDVELSKRGLVAAGWVAPVILAVNLPTSVFAGEISSPEQCQPPSPNPTPPCPTPRPTPKPTYMSAPS